MQVSTLIWAVTVGLILVLILVDLLTASRKAHDVKFKEAIATTLFYVSISIGFGLWVWSYFGSTYGTEFFAAYLVEYSLSVDNLFIFVIILAQFAVPSIHHQKVLLIGVMLAGMSAGGAAGRRGAALRACLRAGAGVVSGVGVSCVSLMCLRCVWFLPSR